MKNVPKNQKVATIETMIVFLLLNFIALSLASVNIKCFMKIRFASANRFELPRVNFSATPADTTASHCDIHDILSTPACPQDNSQNRPWLKDMSEDCLFLHVAGPQKGVGKRPVMVFFYGGSFVSGSISIPLYNPASLAASNNGTIVVVANYRLGAFGFLSSPSLQAKDKTTGNYGLLDQIAALQWVQRNIHLYNGDAGNVTIFGESAGAASVCALMVSPLADGLFSRAIMESGLCQDAHNVDSSDSVSAQLAALVGCAVDDIACLRRIEMKQLISAELQIPQSGALTVWAPTIDDYVLSDVPIKLLQNGQFIDSLTSVMIGTNANETTIFQYRNADGRQYTQQQVLANLAQYGFSSQKAQSIYDAYAQWTSALPFGDSESVTHASTVLSAIVTDFIFTCPSQLVASYLVQNNIQTYAYVFNQTLSCSIYFDPKKVSQATINAFGAYHASELAQVFDTPLDCRDEWNDDEFRLSQRIQQYWTDFAAGRAPWPLFAAAGTIFLQTMPIDAQFIRNYHAQECQMLFSP